MKFSAPNKTRFLRRASCVLVESWLANTAALILLLLSNFLDLFLEIKQKRLGKLRVCARTVTRISDLATRWNSWTRFLLLVGVRVSGDSAGRVWERKTF